MAEIAGLQLIVPSSVSSTGTGSAALSATGKITFSGVLTVSVNDAFSAAYENYLIVVKYKSDITNSNSMNMRLRVGGTDATSTNYNRQYFYADLTSVAAARANSQTTWSHFGNTNGTITCGDHIYINRPFLAARTTARVVSASGYAGAYLLDAAGYQDLSTSYDGFTWYHPSSAEQSGMMTVYGLAD